MTLIDDIEDYSYVDYAVLSLMDRPRTKTAIMKEAIKRYGHIIDHGPYLYGEYSDDVDEAIEGMYADGILKRENGKIGITDYGTELFNAFLDAEELDDDDLIRIKDEILGKGER